MKILIIGQCTLHWGRMEFGNIGNYYIIEPFLRELHRVFPGSSIRTTLQMSEGFCAREHLEVLPMEYYYGWTGDDLKTALAELSSAEIYSKTGYLPFKTEYMKCVLDSDLIIDFSGDLWGDNANFLGEHRFLVGLCKDRVAQLLNKPTVMLAGSPGPFDDQAVKTFAKEVYRGFDLVTNREPISLNILENQGFDTRKTRSLACPAFLFEPRTDRHIGLPARGKSAFGDRAKVGFILCGWNFLEGPFDKNFREDSEYYPFSNAIEKFLENYDVDIYLMSHSNGFPVPPKEFRLQHGRDYVIVEQLYRLLKSKSDDSRVHLIDEVHDAWGTKKLIGKFDMLVSGRIHGAVAGYSQCVPTVAIDYGHEPKAHKINGFARLAGAEKYVADPARKGHLYEKMVDCWENREVCKRSLRERMEVVARDAKRNFESIKEVVG